MRTISNMAELKRLLPHVLFEQFYNNINRGNPAIIPDKVKGLRPVTSIQSNGCYVALAPEFQQDNPRGAFWTFPKSKDVSFVPDGAQTIMTITHENSDWVVKYRLHVKE